MNKYQSSVTRKNINPKMFYRYHRQYMNQYHQIEHPLINYAPYFYNMHLFSSIMHLICLFIYRSCSHSLIPDQNWFMTNLRLSIALSRFCIMHVNYVMLCIISVRVHLISFIILMNYVTLHLFMLYCILFN
jgi:hypothetical protein